jgi:predicted RNA polymerase sigma factor
VIAFGEAGRRSGSVGVEPCWGHRVIVTLVEVCGDGGVAGQRRVEFPRAPRPARGPWASPTATARLRRATALSVRRTTSSYHSTICAQSVSSAFRAGEAIRLTRQLAARSNHEEVAGLLALMLLHHARRPGRTGPDGWLVPLAEQDRSLWNTRLIAEGINVLQTALTRDRLGEFQAQAAIAALHA